MKKIYELTVLLPESAGEKLAKEVVNQALEKVTGRLVDFNFWGKKELAYPIKKQGQAAYAFAQVEVEADKIDSLSKRLRQDERIWRHLVVATEELPGERKIKPVSKKKK